MTKTRRDELLDIIRAARTPQFVPRPVDERIADAVIAWVDQHSTAPTPSWPEIVSVLNDWEGYDGRLGQFSRGMHLLNHLGRGGTLEEYGRPDWAKKLAASAASRAARKQPR